MSDRDVLSDPDVIAALKVLGRRATAELCPDCARRDVPDGHDVCAPCAEERATARKQAWWDRQGDYRGLLASGLQPVEAAERWLAHHLRLRRGGRRSSDVRDAAVSVGIAPRTLRRARARLQEDGRVVVERHGRPRGSATTWRMTSVDERRGGHLDTSGGASSGRGRSQGTDEQEGDA